MKMQNADNQMAERLLKSCCMWPCQNKPAVKISAKGRSIKSCKEHLGKALTRFNQTNNTTDRDLEVNLLSKGD